MHTVFGLEREVMLCEPNEQDGKFLLDEIMQAGNFGHHDERNKKFNMGSYWQNFFGIIGRNIAYFRFAPWDWLMSPIWRDIFCLQELSIERYPEFRQGLDSIFGCNSLELESIDKLHYYIYSRIPYLSYKKYNNLGIVDTTGFAKENYHEIDRYNKDHMPIYSADVILPDNRQITIMSCHLRSSAYTTARRSMNDSDNWLKGIPSYFNNHKIGKRIRDAQAIFLRQIIDSVEHTNRYVFVVGDLNDFNRSTCLQTIRGKDLIDAWWKGGNGFGFTYAGWKLRLRLDHILYPKDFVLSNVYVVDSDVSDHRALIADFKLNI